MKRKTHQRELPEQLPGDLEPVLQRIVAARGISHSEQLQLGLEKLLSFHDLLNVEQAARRLYEALIHQQRVLVVGDYDADGATSCAVTIRALKSFGLQQIDYLVPNRFDYGYGLSPEIVSVAMQSDPDLIITVDNGIASHAGVDAARQAGIDVLVTDHHLPGSQLPDANVIVNPNQPNDLFQSKSLAGVGVVFYIMLALRSLLREQDWFGQKSITEPNLADLLDIVALGTIADVVPLDHNNRILVKQGLRRMRAGKSHAGIRALASVARRDMSYLNTADLGFAIAPRLNAAGRLQDMSVGIECLLTDDDEQAMLLAQQLDDINHERRQISRAMEDEATSMLESLRLEDTDDESVPVVYSLYQPQWHQGVIGILAGRIKEKFHRPTIVFASAGDGQLRGSARSIPGFHIRDAIEVVASANPGLVSRFGGHAMAAGLSLREEDFDYFCQQFEHYASSTLTEEQLQHTIMTDGQLETDELSMHTAMLIEQAGPWGQAYPEPLFQGRFRVLDQKRIGDEQRHVKCRLDNGEISLDAIAFNQSDEVWPEDCHTVDITYRMTINRFRGFENLQLMIQDVLDTQSSGQEN